MSQTPDPTRCPLCGEPNGCALATAPGAPRAECWCATPSFGAALLARVPAQSAGRACICQRCQRASAPDPG